MKLQQIYNATYNYFAEQDLWPQSVSYNPEWEFSEVDNIRHAFDLGKRDGIINKLNNELGNNYFGKNSLDSETISMKK